LRLQIEMDETTQMLRLVDPADDLGPIEGGFPVFLSRWSASWVTPRLAVLPLGAHGAVVFDS
jgi:hypothetical protein